MTQSLLQRYFTRVFYVQLSPQRLTVRNAATGEQISEVPEIAITKPPAKQRVVAVGAAARAVTDGTPVEVINPFTHPRTLVSDFTVAEVLLKAFFKRMPSNGWAQLMPAPCAVMHPLGEWEGGLTQVELRALRELALGAGASNAYVWQGRTLTGAELLAKHLPADGVVDA
jgi:rod shape-determining protein MreB